MVKTNYYYNYRTMKLHFTLIKMLCVAFILMCPQAKAQVTIGRDLAPKSGSLLDLKQNDNLDDNSTKGLLLPRVALEDVVKMGPCIQSDLVQEEDKKSHIGLTVYNVTDSLEVELCPGVYVWEGTRWIRTPEPCESLIGPELLSSPNCYIVSPGGTSEEIPVAKAYLVSESRSDMTALNRTDKVSLKLLWQDTQNLIEGFDFVEPDKGIFSKFTVKARGTAKGNALVALCVGPNGNDSDPIAWSWHIWVTDYDPENGGTTYPHNNGEREYVFMDRNLGAITTTTSDPNSMGMTYQWGRKDPFPPNMEFGDSPSFRIVYDINNNTLTEVDELYTESTGTGIQHKEVTEAKNLASSILNPMTYYYAKRDDADEDGDRADWFTTDDTGASGDNELWGGMSGNKSPFDPCPAGWKVPAMSSATKSPWAKFEGSWSLSFGSTGLNMTGIGFYPYGFPRLPRPIISCVGVGCLGQNYVGGAFSGSSVWNSERGAYWTATGSSNNLAARTTGIVGAGSPQPLLKNLDYSRSGGAYVRCVRDVK